MSKGEEDLGAQYTLYRWHILDPVGFTKSFRFEIEHTGWMSADETSTGEVDGHVEREDDVATVAFWYQLGQPKRFTQLPFSRVPMTIDFDFYDPKEEVKIPDLFSPQLDVRGYYLGSATLKKGKHTIRFGQIGMNANSLGNCLGFDSFRLMEKWNKKRVSPGENSAKSSQANP